MEVATIQGRGFRVRPGGAGGQSCFRCPSGLRRVQHGAFTLIEIMIVVGIMGVVLTMAVPMVYKVWHRAPMNQATKDIVEVLSTARARSILQGKPLHVVFYPRDGRLEVEGGGAQTNSTPALAGMSPGSSGGTAARLSDRVLIQMLDINKLPHDFREDDMARIRFFPNGTSDELTVILVDDKGEQQGITLEVTTGLASVLSGSELQRMRSGVR